MKTLIVSVAKAGHVNQCLALCEHAGWKPNEKIEIPAPGRMTGAFDRLMIKAQQRLLLPRATPRVRTEGPLRIVASGAVSEQVVAAYRSLYGDDLFAAFVGRPKWPSAIFDVAIVSVHALEPEEPQAAFGCPAARETLIMRGVPTRKLAEAGKLEGLTVLIGGTNKAFDIDARAIEAQLAALIGLRPRTPVTVVFSRRTPNTVEQSLRKAFAVPVVSFVARTDRPGFLAAMSSAAEFVVTPDSLTMVSEACATGRPVQIFDLACFDPASSTNRCMADLLAGGEIALAPHGAPSRCGTSACSVPGEFLPLFDDWRAGRPSAGAAPAAKA